VEADPAALHALRCQAIANHELEKLGTIPTVPGRLAHLAVVREAHAEAQRALTALVDLGDGVAREADRERPAIDLARRRDLLEQRERMAGALAVTAGKLDELEAALKRVAAAMQRKQP